MLGGRRAAGALGGGWSAAADVLDDDAGPGALRALAAVWQRARPAAARARDLTGAEGARRSLVARCEVFGGGVLGRRAHGGRLPAPDASIRRLRGTRRGPTTPDRGASDPAGRSRGARVRCGPC